MIIITHDGNQTVFAEYDENDIKAEFTTKKMIKFKDASGEIKDEEFEFKCIVAGKISMAGFENKVLSKEKIKGLIGDCADGEDFMEKIYTGGKIPVRTLITPKMQNPVGRKPFTA